MRIDDFRFSEDGDFSKNEYDGKWDDLETESSRYLFHRANAYRSILLLQSVFLKEREKERGSNSVLRIVDICLLCIGCHTLFLFPIEAIEESARGGISCKKYRTDIAYYPRST